LLTLQKKCARKRTGSAQASALRPSRVESAFGCAAPSQANHIAPAGYDPIDGLASFSATRSARSGPSHRRPPKQGISRANCDAAWPRSTDAEEGSALPKRTSKWFRLNTALRMIALANREKARLGNFRVLRGSWPCDIVQFCCFVRDLATTIDDQMTTVPMPIPGSEFNDFLFASIGEDRNGMLVSVLSGLARSDVDPWQEAAKLAQLPGEVATKELAALIGALPDGAAPSSDPRTIATRLIALLPHRGALSVEPRATTQSAWAVMNSRPWWIYVVFMCFVLGSQFVIASHQLPAKPVNLEVKAAGILSSPVVPPANSGQ
jgi:hypothetical protein